MEEQTIDLKVLLKVFTGHIVPIAIAAVISAVLGFVLAFAVIPKQYTSEALMYVENSSAKTDDSAININDINAAQKLVNTCQILFTSDYILGRLSDRIDGVYSAEELKDMISIESVNSTEVLKISAVSLNPNNSKIIADILVELSKEEFHRVIKNGSIEVVSEAAVPEKHTFPSVPQFTVIGFFLGFLLSYFVCLIIEILDVRVKEEDDLAQIYNIPVFAEIVDFVSADKSGYKYKKYSQYAPYSASDSVTDTESDFDDENEYFDE